LAARSRASRCSVSTFGLCRGVKLHIRHES
jgi:hypothetical protein